VAIKGAGTAAPDTAGDDILTGSAINPMLLPAPDPIAFRSRRLHQRPDALGGLLSCTNSVTGLYSCDLDDSRRGAWDNREEI